MELKLKVEEEAMAWRGPMDTEHEMCVRKYNSVLPMYTHGKHVTWASGGNANSKKRRDGSGPAAGTLVSRLVRLTVTSCDFHLLAS